MELRLEVQPLQSNLMDQRYRTNKSIAVPSFTSIHHNYFVLQFMRETQSAGGAQCIRQTVGGNTESCLGLRPFFKPDPKCHLQPEEGS